MSDFGDRVRLMIRAALRVPATIVRRMLTPAQRPVVFKWHRVVGGPAAGAEVLLPDQGAIVDPITTGRYEESVMSVVQALVTPTDVCFDIGGHYGYYTLSLAKLACSGQVHVFEPVVAHADRIREAAKRSGLSNVTVRQVAVAGEAGPMTLRFAETEGADDSMAYLETYGGVNSSAAEHHYCSFSETVVLAVTLDSMVELSCLPGFIKIDAEGAEVAILMAGLQLIAAANPRILIEIHGINEALGCANLLRSMDYCVILLSDQKITLPILLVPNDDEQAVSLVTKVMGRAPTILFGKGADRSQYE